MARDLVGPRLQILLACAEAGLTKAVSRAQIQVGSEVAWDDCCDGQLTVRIINMTPFYGQAGAGGSACGPLYWNLTVGVGVIRCASTVNDNGVAPTAATITTEALQMTQDQADLMQAIQCCSVVRAMGPWSASGPMGGCAGGEWTAILKIDNCPCP